MNSAVINAVEKTLNNSQFKKKKTMIYINSKVTAISAKPARATKHHTSMEKTLVDTTKNKPRSYKVIPSRYSATMANGTIPVRKQCGLTDVELQFAAGWRTVMKIDMTQKKHWSFLRYDLRCVAFHEAAHVVTSMFTGHEDGHINKVSVIPDKDRKGCVYTERSMDPERLKAMPPGLVPLIGRKMLLDYLSGRGAEMRVSHSKDYREILDKDNWCEEIKVKGTDCFKAKRVAKIMAKPGMPAHRILTLAAQWTHEMLDIPAVWRTVERLADMLCSRGVIDNNDTLIDVCQEIRWMSFGMPEWQLRLGTIPE